MMVELIISARGKFLQMVPEVLKSKVGRMEDEISKKKNMKTKFSQILLNLWTEQIIKMRLILTGRHVTS